eukprot:scaffold54965_cov35-Cyclotella_meneghiniana.AAC.1
MTPITNDALQPSLVSFAVESVTAGPISNDELNKKRIRQTQSGVVKLEDVHNSLDNLKQIEIAISAAKDYLQATSDGTKNNPAIDVLDWSISQLSTERNWISKKVNCTKEKKQSQQAHAKVTKGQRQQAAHLVAISKKSNTSTPRKILLSIWDNVKRLISKHPVTEENSSNVLSTLPRQKKPRSQSTTVAAPGKSAPIRLPLPSDKVHLKYTPQEAVAVYMWADKNKERLCGSSNKNEQRTYMKRIKDDMVERYLPINISRLNELIQKHAGPGLPPPP